MTSRHNESKLAAELNRLLAAASLGDASDSELARLNELLLNDRELRQQAAQFFEEEVVLRREFEILDRVGEFHNPRTLGRANALEVGGGESCRTRLAPNVRQRLFLAVAVLVSSIVGWMSIHHGGWWLWQGRSQGEAGISLPTFDSGMEGPATARALQPLTASILTPVIRVSWSGPQFASELNASPMIAAIHEGVISFTSSFGRPAQGYVVCLRPGALMDLIVTADAEGENALAAIEIDGSGKPTGRRISFSNSAEEGSATGKSDGKYAVRTKKGRLGIWTDRNDGPTPRYYLFTGVHKLLNRSADDSWHVSRLQPFVESENLIHVGWDDSGMPFAGKQDAAQVPDNDFDDVSATIRIRMPSSPAPNSDVQVLSKNRKYEVSGLSLPSQDAERYLLTLNPGQSAIVKVSSRSGAPVDVGVFGKETGELRWRCRQEPNSDSPTLGICAIKNDSPRVKEFFVVGAQREASADPFAAVHAMPASVLFNKENVVTVGFGDVEKTLDFNLLKVDILTMGDQ
ncbi:MAG TPA: hypothetical protein VGI75_02075 [Pirellulales bacterium]